MNLKLKILLPILEYYLRNVHALQILHRHPISIHPVVLYYKLAQFPAVISKTYYSNSSTGFLWSLGSSFKLKSMHDMFIEKGNIHSNCTSQLFTNSRVNRSRPKVTDCHIQRESKTNTQKVR